MVDGSAAIDAVEKAKPDAKSGQMHGQQLVTIQNIKIGMLVRPGPDWQWGDQGVENGVIRGILPSGWATVKWPHDNRKKNYRIGQKEKYDLVQSHDSALDLFGDVRHCRTRHSLHSLAATSVPHRSSIIDPLTYAGQQTSSMGAAKGNVNIRTRKGLRLKAANQQVEIRELLKQTFHSDVPRDQRLNICALRVQEQQERQDSKRRNHGDAASSSDRKASLVNPVSEPIDGDVTQQALAHPAHSLKGLSVEVEKDKDSVSVCDIGKMEKSPIEKQRKVKKKKKTKGKTAVASKRAAENMQKEDIEEKGDVKNAVENEKSEPANRIEVSVADEVCEVDRKRKKDVPDEVCEVDRKRKKDAPDEIVSDRPIQRRKLNIMKEVRKRDNDVKRKKILAVKQKEAKRTARSQESIVERTDGRRKRGTHVVSPKKDRRKKRVESHTMKTNINQKPKKSVVKRTIKDVERTKMKTKKCMKVTEVRRKKDESKCNGVRRTQKQKQQERKMRNKMLASGKKVGKR